MTALETTRYSPVLAVKLLKQYFKRLRAIEISVRGEEFVVKTGGVFTQWDKMWR